MGTSSFAVPIIKNCMKKIFNICSLYTTTTKVSAGAKINQSPIQDISENLNIECRTPASLKTIKKNLNFLKS